MKVLIATLLIFISMINPIKADEYSNNGTYIINLSCNKAPSYSVKIPKSVSIENTSTQLDFEVKGDLYNTQNLNIVFDSSTYLTYGTKTELVTIHQTKSSWTNQELSNNYLPSYITITHNPLSAGNWTGTLNVTIQLGEV